MARLTVCTSARHTPQPVTAIMAVCLVIKPAGFRIKLVGSRTISVLTLVCRLSGVIYVLTRTSGTITTLCKPFYNVGARTAWLTT